jgi:integrase
MNRPRKKDKHLPRNVYLRSGAYYFVREGKWMPLGKSLPAALEEYARLIVPEVSGGCNELLSRTLKRLEERKELSANTLSQYAVVCKQLKFNLAKFTPDQVKGKHVAAILDHDRATPNMANRKLTFLRWAFAYGMTWGMCEFNPAMGQKRHIEKKRTRYLTDEEFARIKAEANPSIRSIIDICYLTAQRISDVLAVHRQDISDRGIYFRPIKTKGSTGKQLLVRMTPDLKAAVERAKALHGNVRGLTLFHGRGGRQLGYSGVRGAFDRACEAAGVEDATLHDVRAKALTDAKKQGKDNQKLGGHTTEDRANRYIRDREIDEVEGPSFG